MAYSIVIVFQRCICDETMKYSPQETALSLFWKGRMHLLGTVAVGSEMRGASRAAPPAKARGSLSLHFEDARKEKEVGGFHLPARRSSHLLPERGRFPSAVLGICMCEPEGDKQHRSDYFTAHTHRQAELHAKGISLL